VIAGHFGFAAMVKARRPAVPLWALMVATQWLDVIFVPLFVAGIETLTPLHGADSHYGEVIIHADYTHSLVGALFLSALYGAFFLGRLGRGGALTLAGVSFSHWVLDLVVHRADLPLLPGNAGGLPRLGFGIWRFEAVSIALELLLVLGGAALYWRAALRASHGAHVGTGRAHVAGSVALVSGLVTLGLNVMNL
jgi:membrane-bound metal-dependent hydrolase YbcI (DUF457 family)